MKRRTKIATILTTGLLSAALVGVGFAAWTITTGKEAPGQKGGTVTADNVSVSGLDYEVEVTNSEAKLGKKTASVSAPWLDAAAVDEDLELEITITLNYGSFQKIDLDADLGGYATLAGTDASTGGYLAAVKYTKDETSTLTEAQVDQDTGNITFTSNHYEVSEKKTIVVKITLGWGDRFDGKNPYEFFNGQVYGTKMSVYGGEYEASSGKYEARGDEMNYAYAEDVLSHIYETLGDGNLTAHFTYTATQYSA